MRVLLPGQPDLAGHVVLGVAGGHEDAGQDDHRGRPLVHEAGDAFLDGRPGELEEAKLGRLPGPAVAEGTSKLQELGDAVGIAAAVAGDEQCVGHGVGSSAGVRSSFWREGLERMRGDEVNEKN